MTGVCISQPSTGCYLSFLNTAEWAMPKAWANNEPASEQRGKLEKAI